MRTHDLHHLEFNGFKHGTSHMSNQMIWFGEWKVWHLNLTENAWRSASYIWNVPIISINYTLCVSIIYGCYYKYLLEVLYIFYTFFKDSQRNCQKFSFPAELHAQYLVISFPTPAKP